jgi:hypothetical protein
MSHLAIYREISSVMQIAGASFPTITAIGLVVDSKHRDSAGRSVKPPLG